MRRFGKATQEGTFLRFFREAQKTLIHYKQAPGFFTALPDPFKKSCRDKLPGRVVRITEEDQIRLRGNSVQNGFRKDKILFLLTEDALDPASGQSEGMLVLRKSGNRNQGIFRLQQQYQSVNQVCRTVSANDGFGRNTKPGGECAAELCAVRVGIAVSTVKRGKHCFSDS